jgi:GNAT superfamily N-acetyltransferase
MELYKIRNSTKEDMAAVLNLIIELAVYEREPEAVETTVAILQRDGFGHDPVFDCFVAEKDGAVVGFALVYTCYSTWKGKSLYLEDLYVKQDLRGLGIGAGLFERVIQEAKDRGAKRMDWQVIDWNEPAINFYKKYKAKLDPEWINGRFSEDDLKQFGGTLETPQ